MGEAAEHIEEEKMNQPEYVKMILDRLERSGHEAFVVGGAVRDALLKRSLNDYDVTTSALPAQVAEIFSDFHVIETGLKHGTVTVVVDRKPVEITTYRFDGAYNDSRHPEEVRFTRNVEDDLARRDFTVNAMAYSEKRGLVDLFGGAIDLKQGIIRAVGEPERRFTEDALRIMRAFRFASKLDFRIEPATLEAAVKCRFGLKNISTERKTVELEGILLGVGVKKTLFAMHDAGIFEVIAPSINLDTTRFENISRLPADFSCRMAFCLVGQENSDAYISSLRLSNAVAGRIRKLVRLAEMPLSVSTAPELRRLMAEAGEELDHLLSIKKALGESVVGIRGRAEKIAKRGDCLNIKSLAVDGKDLALIGISGKNIGIALNALLEAVLDNPRLNDKQKLLKIAQNMTL